MDFFISYPDTRIRISVLKLEELLFFKFILFLNLLSAALGRLCCARAFSSCAEQGLHCGARASHCGGFSLQSTGSRRSGFSSCGSRALEHRLSSCGARA